MTDLSPWQKYKQNLGDSRPWDLLRPNTEYVTKDVSEQRFSICESCPELIKVTSQCKKCGCFMRVKTMMSIASCPLNKW